SPRLDAQRAAAVVGADFDLLDFAQLKGKPAAWMAFVQGDQPAVRQHRAGTRRKKAVERQVAGKGVDDPFILIEQLHILIRQDGAGCHKRVPPLLMARSCRSLLLALRPRAKGPIAERASGALRSEEHTSELQSRENLVCRLLLEKKKQE